MNPFAAQHRAFLLADAGDFTEATTFFVEALKGFRRLVSDSRVRQFVIERASAIQGRPENAEGVAEEFLHSLPGWLRELHFDSFYNALTSYQMKLARMHWTLLLAAAEQADLTSKMSLDILREQVCQRRKITCEGIEENESELQKVLDRSEDILAIDGGNKTARRIAITIYTARLKSALERLAGNLDKKRVVRAISGMSESKKQRLHDSGKTVRRLRQHLRRAQSRGDADIEEMVDSYWHLSQYYLGVGELETAIKLTRRARRLRPQDENLRVWARSIRQLRRRG